MNYIWYIPRVDVSIVIRASIVLSKRLLLFVC